MISRSWLHLAALLAAFAPPAPAADLAALRALFATEFQTRYVGGRCGDNTLGFAAEALARGIDLERALVVRAEDFWGDFGMIAGRRAREEGPLIRPAPLSGPERAAGRRNWYFHVFLVAEETVDPARAGEIAVFDMSFENEPTVVGLGEYLARMFYADPAKRDLKSRHAHLRGFILDTYDASRTPSSGVHNPPAIREKAWLAKIAPEYFARADFGDAELFGILATPAR